MSLLEWELVDGGKVWASSLHLVSTYAHAYEGVPTRETNDQYLAHFPARAELFLRGSYPVFIIQPRRTPRVVAGVQAEFLPPYWCLAECYGNGMRTCLAIVWFQDEPAPWPSAEILEKLKAIDWDRHAEEFLP